MKKIRKFSLFLALLLLLQTISPVALATETTEAPTVPETTAPVPDVDIYAENTHEYGAISTAEGCRTIDALMPLVGSDRRLETTQAAFVYELNSETVIYSYNPDMKLLPATLSKLLVAMIVIEQGNLDDQVTISMREISHLPLRALVVKLKEGEQLTVRDLLYSMIVASANDACLALAEYIAGDEASFVKIMNERVAELGCANTHFTNSHGLDAEGQYTTARDMAKIIQAAMEYEEFREVFAANTYTVPETNKSDERELRSTNYLREQLTVPKFNDKRVTGGKSGSTDQGGRCLVATAEEGNMSMIYVILGAVARFSERGTTEYYGNFEEMIELLQFGFGEHKHNLILYNEQPLTKFPVANGENVVIAGPHVQMSCTLPKGATMDTLIIKYTVEGGGLTAPIAEGQKVGMVQLWYQSSCLAEVELYALHDVRSLEEADMHFSNSASRDDSNTGLVLAILGGVLLVVLLVIGGFFAYAAIRRSMVRNRRRRRRMSRRRSR